MVARLFSPEIETQIAQEYADGEQSTTLAKKYNCTYATIWNIAKRQGVKPKPFGGGKKHAEHNRWKGGRNITRRGYVETYVTDDDPMASMRPKGHRYVREHRLVLARHLGRPLEKHETVHHINGDPLDNRIENLQLRRNAHGQGQMHRCLDCGSHNISPVPLD